MILSNIELQRALDEGRLAISPEPAPRFPSLENPHCPYDTHSVDLHLADEIVVPNRDSVYSYDLTHPGSLARTIQQNSTTSKISVDQPFGLPRSS